MNQNDYCIIKTLKLFIGFPRVINVVECAVVHHLSTRLTLILLLLYSLSVKTQCCLDKVKDCTWYNI